MPYCAETKTWSSTTSGVRGVDRRPDAGAPAPAEAFPAAVRIEAHQVVAREEQRVADTVEGRRHGRRVARLLAGERPQHLARIGVEGDDAGIRTADVRDHPAVLDQRHPRRPEEGLPEAEALAGIDAPDSRAALEVDGMQLSPAPRTYTRVHRPRPAPTGAPLRTRNRRGSSSGSRSARSHPRWRHRAPRSLPGPGPDETGAGDHRRLRGRRSPRRPAAATAPAASRRPTRAPAAVRRSGRRGRGPGSAASPAPRASRRRRCTRPRRSECARRVSRQSAVQGPRSFANLRARAPLLHRRAAAPLLHRRAAAPLLHRRAAAPLLHQRAAAPRPRHGRRPTGRGVVLRPAARHSLASAAYTTWSTK